MLIIATNEKNHNNFEIRHSKLTVLVRLYQPEIIQRYKALVRIYELLFLSGFN